MGQGLVLPTRGDFQSRDLDETRQIVSQMFCEHRLDSGRHAVDYGHVLQRLGAFSFCRMRYGADVRIEPGALASFFLIQVPLSGQDLFRCDGVEALADCQHVSLHAPESTLAMRWSADCEKFVVRIERQALERHLAGVAEISAARPFPSLVALEQGQVRAWVESARYVFEALCRQPTMADEPLLRAQFKELLLTTAVSWLPLARAPVERVVLPRHVRQAEDYLRAHADQPLTIDHVAEQVGVSGRTLHEGFRKFLGVSPMRYLRDLRMARARADLCDGTPSRSVTAVATHWGFFQLGRFAADYRQRYGESPHETLKRSL